MSVLDSLVSAALPITPKFVVGRVARRYIAGETFEEALEVIRGLEARACTATVDVLGEFVNERSEADATAREYERVLDAIARAGLRTTISVKLTAVGLLLDEGECLARVRGLAQKAAEGRTSVTIDMEDSRCTDATLRILRALAKEGLAVGGVLQAYLRRTDRDAAALAAEGIPVRLCKGIYREPPEIAFQGREEIRESWRRNLRTLIEGKGVVQIATHDDVLVEYARKLLAELRVPRDRYEFQMLLGVREWLRDEIVAQGHPMRVYVPFGRAWYGYSVRRLRENPAVAGHVFRAVLGLR